MVSSACVDSVPEYCSEYCCGLGKGIDESKISGWRFLLMEDPAT
jgi:hypothetical protein